MDVFLFYDKKLIEVVTDFPVEDFPKHGLRNILRMHSIYPWDYTMTTMKTSESILSSMARAYKKEVAANYDKVKKTRFKDFMKEYRVTASYSRSTKRYKYNYDYEEIT